MHAVALHPDQRDELVVGQKHREHQIFDLRAVRLDGGRDCITNTRFHWQDSHRVRQRNEGVVGNLLVSLVLEQKVDEPLGSR